MDKQEFEAADYIRKLKKKLTSAEGAHDATLDKIQKIGDFKKPEAVQLAVNLLAYNLEVSVHQRDLYSAEIESGLRAKDEYGGTVEAELDNSRQFEAILIKAQRGDYTDLKKWLVSYGGTFSDEKPDLWHSLQDLNNFLPVHGDPINPPTLPAWMDPEFSEFDSG